jgi:hypothetical protein
MPPRPATQGTPACRLSEIETCENSVWAIELSKSYGFYTGFASTNPETRDERTGERECFRLAEGQKKSHRFERP